MENMKNLKLKSNDLYALLGVVVLVAVIGFGVIGYATNLREQIQSEKEIKKLEKEKLILEIQIMKQNKTITR